MNALDNINFYNPFLENLKKIDGLVVCKTKNDVEIHCCIAIKSVVELKQDVFTIKTKNGAYAIGEIIDTIKQDIDCVIDSDFFLDKQKGCYLRCYVDNIEYVTIIVQFVE